MCVCVCVLTCCLRTQVRMMCRQADNQVTTTKTERACHVLFCVSTFKRHWQIEKALPINVVLTWPYRQHVSWCIADLNEASDSRLLDFATENLRLAMCEDHLRICKTVEESGLVHWHASTAKNSSHLCAVQMMEDKAPGVLDFVLCNVDNDNILTREFVEDIIAKSAEMIVPAGLDVSTLPKKNKPKWPCLGCLRYRSPECAGTTGRVALAWKLFSLLRGYDEQLGPSGYQEIDIAIRASQVALSTLHKGLFVGDVISNLPDKTSITDFKTHCVVKTQHCDPKIRESHHGKWTKMNTVNMQDAKDKLKRGELIRNLHKTQIGMPMRAVLIEGMTPLPSSSGVSLEPTSGVSLVEAAPPNEFSIITFGAEKLAGSFRHSAACHAIRQQIRANAAHGGPPWAVEEDLLLQAMSEIGQPVPHHIFDARCLLVTCSVSVNVTCPVCDVLGRTCCIAGASTSMMRGFARRRKVISAATQARCRGSRSTSLLCPRCRPLH